MMEFICRWRIKNLRGKWLIFKLPIWQIWNVSSKNLLEGI
jgi:hypothetical protein